MGVAVLAGGTGNKRTVLVVDDQSGIRRLLEELLLEEGFRVLLAENGEDALRETAKKPPDLAMLDVKMPGLNGLEVLQEFRRREYSFPVILMTAFGESGVVEQARDLGVVHSLTKPFDIKDARLMVRQLME